MKKKKFLIIGLIIIIMLVIGIILITKNKQKESESSATIEEVTATKMTLQNTITSSGQITADTVDLSLSTTKTFKSILVTESQYVAKGTKMIKYSNGTYLKAPYNLVVVSYSIPGSGSKARDNHYIEVYKINTLKMSLSIDEDELSKVAVNQEVEITANAITHKTYTGKITKINQIGSYSSSGSTFDAIIKFANDGNLKIGMSASASVIIESVEDAIAIPIEAVQTKGTTKYAVLVNDDGTTSNVEITTGISNDAYVEVKTGLEEGDTIQMIKETTTNSSSKRNQFFNRGDGNMSSMPSGDMPSNFNSNSFNRKGN